MKVYQLSDGTYATAQELADRSGLSISTIYTRLRKTRDVDTLFRSVAEARRDTGWHRTQGRLFFKNRNKQVPYE